MHRMFSPLQDNEGRQVDRKGTKSAHPDRRDRSPQHNNRAFGPHSVGVVFTFS